jgi:hypothetical protein
MGLAEWREFVKGWGERNNVRYICAISDPRCSKEYHEKMGHVMPKREPAMRTATKQYATMESIKIYPASIKTVKPPVRRVPEEMMLMMSRREPATRTAITTYSTIEPIMGAVPFTEARKKFKVGQRVPMSPAAKIALAEHAKRKKAEALKKKS